MLGAVFSGTKDALRVDPKMSIETPYMRHMRVIERIYEWNRGAPIVTQERAAFRRKSITQEGRLPTEKTF